MFLSLHLRFASNSLIEFNLYGEERINRRSRNKQQIKLDSLLNQNTNETSNEINSVNATQNYTMNRTALFVTGRNRCKNKNNTRRRKSNWLKPEQR